MEHSLKEAYERDGYVVVENLFSQAEIASFKAEINSITSKRNEDGNRGNNFSTGVYVGLAKQSGMLQVLATDQRIADALYAAMDVEEILFLSDKVVAKDAEKDFPSPWHQDWSYWYGSHKVSVWIALDDATPENGCLKMIPGSHRLVVEHAVHNNDKEGFNHRILESEFDFNKSVDIAAKAGTAVIFHDLTIHSSYPNTTGKDRWALISTYKDGAQPDPEFSWANPLKLKKT
jgi:phytanoyl-CoA hydroxylase